MSKTKILVKGTNWLGDVIISLPAIAYLKKQNPDSAIYVLSKKNVAGVYSFAPYVDGVIEYDLGKGVKNYIRDLLKLRVLLKSYDFKKAYVFPNSFSSALFCFFSGAGKIVGYAKNLRSFMLTDVVAKTSKKHQVFSYLNIVGSTAAFTETKELLSVSSDLRHKIVNEFLGDISAEDILIGVAPGAAFGGAKRLPAFKYREIIAGILSRNPKVRFMFLGTDADKPYCDEIVNSFEIAEQKRFYNLSGKTSLSAVTVLSSLCKLFLSNDSGLMHLASVLGVYTVAFFGPTIEEHTSPLGDFQIIRSSEKIDCVPCMKRECLQNNHKCMETIDTDAAVSEIMQHL